MTGQSRQVVDLGRGEETPGDVDVIRLLANELDIDADARGMRDRDKDQPVRMREIETERAAESRAEVRLAGFVVDEIDLPGLDTEVAPQDVTQYSARGDEMLPITLEAETGTPAVFVGRKRFIQASSGFGGNIKTGAPGMNLARPEANVAHATFTSMVGEQSASCAASAIATSTSRAPSKRSRPCAVLTLSTSIRSPGCHGSRTVWAS